MEASASSALRRECSLRTTDIIAFMDEPSASRLLSDSICTDTQSTHIRLAFFLAQRSGYYNSLVHGYGITSGPVFSLRSSMPLRLSGDVPVISGMEELVV